jgi:hypothetical protein
MSERGDADCAFQMRNGVKYMIKINGVYDILCALSVLRIIYIPYLNELHLSMMKDYSSPLISEIRTLQLFERFFSYWIFTYGVVRLSNNYQIVSYSYYIEAVFFINECIYNSVYVPQAFFVIGSSFLLGYLVDTHLKN